ncbi:MAG: glutamate racemase [Deltaproteobacteria bacterium]|nr:glutamate racemase [Deltaproteobacteria bacterium]
MGISSSLSPASSIGIFDSGVGGLTVFEAIQEQLPQENLVYLGDTARVPYGNKSRETITRYSIENTKFLLQCGIKVLIIACNTASALAISELQKQFSLPIIGVIEPGALAAVATTKTKEVAVIGTESTIRSASYAKAIAQLNPAIRVWGTACPLFVPLAEEGWMDEEVTKLVAEKYLSSFHKTPIDTIILGCTHYPLLKKRIAQVMGVSVTLVDSAEQTALALQQLLQKESLQNPQIQKGSETFFVTDSPDRFRQVGRTFLGRPLEGVTLVSV